MLPPGGTLPTLSTQEPPACVASLPENLLFFRESPEDTFWDPKDPALSSFWLWGAEWELQVAYLGDLLPYSPHWAEGDGHEGLWPQQVHPRLWLSLFPQPWLHGSSSVSQASEVRTVPRRDRSQSALHKCGLI